MPSTSLPDDISILYIDVLDDCVYIESIDHISHYYSYHKTKQLIRRCGNNTIKYECVDSQRAVDFLNKLPGYSLSAIDNEQCLVKKCK